MKESNDTTKTGMLHHFNSSGSSAMLRLGKLLYHLSECLSPASLRDPSGKAKEMIPDILEAGDRLREFLHASSSKILRTAFDYDGCNKHIDDVEMRIICYVAYVHFVSDSKMTPLPAMLRAVVLGDARPEVLLDAQVSCGTLCCRGVLAYRMDSPWRGELILGHDLVCYIAGGADSPLSIFYPEYLQRPIGPLGGSGMNRQPSSANGTDSGAKNGHRASHHCGPQVDPQNSARILYQMIREKVIGIDGAVRILSGRLAAHILRAKLIRQGKDPQTPNECLLFLGPSGCGKTYLAETAGKVTCLPFAAINATDFTAEGYVGLSVEDALRPLVDAAGGNLEQSRFGICFLDEWDKKAAHGTGHAGQFDITGVAVQQSFLRIMEGCLTQLGGRRSNGQPPRTFDSRGTFLIFAGAFVGLEHVQTKRMQNKSSIGFTVSREERRFKESGIYDTLLEYGLIPEFLNRLTGIVQIPAPTREQLIAIATAPTGILAAYHDLLAAVGSGLKAHDSGIRMMVEYSLETKTFARGIKCIVSQLAGEILFNGSPQIIEVNRDIVRVIIDSMQKGITA